MGSSQYDELFLSNTMAFKYYQISNSCSFMKESTTELFYKKIKSSNTKICLPIHTSLLNGLFCRNGYMDYLFFEKKVFTYKKKKKDQDEHSGVSAVSRQLKQDGQQWGWQKNEYCPSFTAYQSLEVDPGLGTYSSTYCHLTNSPPGW